MADQLAIYNVALAHLGERRLASLAEPREPARVLADEWDAAVTGCLQMAAWSFATRTQEVDATSPGAGPFSNAIPKPADWLRTVDLALDAALTTPPDGYLEEGGFWYASAAGLFIRFVSSNTAYGFNVARWHQPFADLVALALAARACRRLTGAADMLGDLIKLREQATQEALTYEEQTAARQYPAPSGAGENRLQAYNDALAHLGRARVHSLTQATDAVRELNDQYRGALRWCLQRAPWAFAAATTGLAVVAGIAPRVGFGSALAKPVDHILTLNVAQDGDLQVPVPRYVEEGGYFYADPAGITIRYVSATVGADPTRWPPLFCDLLALRLAEVCAGRLAQSPKDVVPAIVKMRQDAEMAAQASEAESVARVYPGSAAASPQLQVCNDALAHIGQRRIGSLTEVSEVVRTLNDQWPDAVLWCLQQAPWQFAATEALVLPAAGTAPASAYPYAFAKPADWVMTLDVAKDAQITLPVFDFAEEAGFWLADVTPLGVRYVSSAAAFGLNVAAWPPSFRDFVALRLAQMVGPRLGGAMPEALPGKVEAARGAAVDIEVSRTQRSFPYDAPGATVLRIYNDAMAYLGRPRIAALTEAHPTMRVFTDEFALAVRWALEQGPWTFAIRAIMIGPWSDMVPTFGFKNAFKKPDDWLQTVEVSEFDDFRAGATAYADETGFWFSDAPGLFIRYVSLGANYGTNLPRWNPSFADLVAVRMAEKAAPRLQLPQTRIVELVQRREDAMKRLRATDALNTPPVFPPQGSWVQARRGRWSTGRRFGDGPGGPGRPFTGDTTLGGDSDLPINSDFVPRISG